MMDDKSKRDFANVPVVWEPKEDSGKFTKQFMKKIQDKYNVKISDFWDLHKWSVENVDKFWEEIWHLSGIIYSKPYHQVIDPNIPMGEFHEWFAGAQMNYAENLLRYRDDRVALVVAGEDRETEYVTYAQVYENAKLYAAALRKQGVKKGSVVTCFMSNRKEAIFAMIAATSMGAIWTGALPLMGAQAVLNLFTQMDPKILFTVDRFSHNKEEHDMLSKLKIIAEGLPCLEKIVIVASKPNSKLKDISCIRNSCFLDDFLETGKNPDGSIPEMVFAQVPFTYPIFISCTSGTTGKPKAFYHGSAVLLAVYRDFWLQNNADRNTCWFSASPVGWGTWNMFTSMLFLGFKIVIFEGHPYFLTPTFFWDMVDRFEISHLLIVPSILDDMQKKGYAPTKQHRLSSLKFVMSGGSVVKSQNYEFAYKEIKSDMIFTSAYGSTECVGTALMPDETLRVHKCELPNASLGIECQCVDDSGKPLLGSVGDLVFAVPIPHLPLGILADNNRTLYKEKYCEKYPGKFYSGDYAIINPITKGIIICGRSDETLKPGGCRFGSSEIYDIVDTFPEIEDSICVSQYSKKKIERAVLFLKMKSGHVFSDCLVERLRNAITKELSDRHVPEVILEVKDIPRNMNDKKMESVVKRIINKMPYDAVTVVNPECLKNYIDVPELNGF